MTTTITRAADLPSARWRNGQGRTTEIALAGPPDAFTWRVSLAEVARDSDFSPFPGIDRIITLVEGTSMTLHLPGRTHVLRPDEPFGFDGGVPVRCSVDRPTRDLNVMTRRGAARGRLDVYRLAADDDALVVPRADTVVLVVLDGTVTLTSDGGATLGTGDVAIADEPLVLGGTARVAVARIDADPAAPLPGTTCQ
ncbi:HutD family protein [Nocardioides sp. LHD-245]|uniref:HutD/Ves family protein n=1 Tax=Nocardioides sp. LHD-245 TaxID=3051387 RepID=UPI0027E14264|nr:HutD family protein [Nocardioides sp. LHD-245]